MTIKKGSAEKRHRQSQKRRIHNRAVRSKVRSSIREFIAAVDSKDPTSAESRFQSAVKLMDGARQKGVYHKNTVARTKSRLHKKLKSLS
mgnify:FL=1